MPLAKSIGYHPSEQIKQPSKLVVWGDTVGLTESGFTLDGTPIYDEEFCEEVPHIPSLVTLEGFLPKIITVMLQISKQTFQLMYGAMWKNDKLVYPEPKLAYPGMVISGNSDFVRDLKIIPRRTSTGVYCELKNAYAKTFEFLRFSVLDRMTWKVQFSPCLGEDIDAEIFKIDYKG
jgi:hypothetical protein